MVTTASHKTLRGPRGGVILTNDEEIAKKINKSIFPGTQGGPLMHVIAAKAVAFGEALTPEFKAYQHQIVLNARAMSKRFLENGVNLVSGGTDNHLMLLDLTSNHITGKELEGLLDDAHITVNKNAIPFDTEKPFVTSGVRIGTPSITQRGMKEEDCVYIADLITDIIKNRAEAVERVKNAVIALCEKYPIYANDIL